MSGSWWDVLDWRRQVAGLYHAVRAEDDPRAAHRLWVSGREQDLIALRKLADGASPTPMPVTKMPGPIDTGARSDGRTDLDTLPAPEEVVKSLLPLCLPTCSESGKVYDFPSQQFLTFHPPS